MPGMTGATYIQATDPPEYMRQAWVDKATSYTAAQAITAALFARERGSGGQHLRLSCSKPASPSCGRTVTPTR